MNRRCGNCGGGIGELETSFAYRGHEVCAACATRLKGAVPIVRPIAPPAAPPDVLDELAAAMSARPIEYRTAAPPSHPVTIELTSKHWKAMMLICAPPAMGGAFLAFWDEGHFKLWTALAVVGAVGFAVARIGAWWENG